MSTPQNVNPNLNLSESQFNVLSPEQRKAFFEQERRQSLEATGDPAHFARERVKRWKAGDASRDATEPVETTVHVDFRLPNETSASEPPLKAAPVPNYDFQKEVKDYERARAEVEAVGFAPVELVFKYEAQPNPAFHFALGPAEGANEGWFPLGEPSLVAGPSGASKSTLMNDLLEKQSAGVEYLGHPTFKMPYLVIGADRGENAQTRTLARMHIDASKFPFAGIPVMQGMAAVKAILQKIEERRLANGIVFIEGADLLVENINDGKFVAPFLSNLQKIAAHYHLAMVCSVGSPKTKVGQGYVSKRENVIGSIVWARMAETILVLQYRDGDDIDKRRAVSVLPRNSAAEKYAMTFEDGRLVVDATQAGEEPVDADVRWFHQQKGWFTPQDVVKGLGVSQATAYRAVEDAYTKHILKTKQKKSGEARQYRWNDSETNPISQYGPGIPKIVIVEPGDQPREEGDE